jgi:hypothetical protein
VDGWETHLAQKNVRHVERSAMWPRCWALDGTVSVLAALGVLLFKHDQLLTGPTEIARRLPGFGNCPSSTTMQGLSFHENPKENGVLRRDRWPRFRVAENVGNAPRTHNRLAVTLDHHRDVLRSRLRPALLATAGTANLGCRDLFGRVCGWLANYPDPPANSTGTPPHVFSGFQPSAYLCADVITDSPSIANNNR